MNNCMLDLETVGTRPGCAVLSIGAAMFDFEAMKIGETFYQAIVPESNKTFGLHFDPSTEQWWSRQSEEARAVWSDPNAMALDEVLTMFSAWCREQAGIRSFYVWGNGANFDDPVLAAAYHATGINKPWEFWNSRCYRTIKSLSPAVPLIKPTVAHNALADALAQAQAALDMFAALKGSAKPAAQTRAAKALAKKFATPVVTSKTIQATKKVAKK